MQCVFEHFLVRMGRRKFPLGGDLMLLDLLTHSRAFRLSCRSFSRIFRSLLKIGCYILCCLEILWTTEANEQFRKFWKFLVFSKINTLSELVLFYLLFFILIHYKNINAKYEAKNFFAKKRIVRVFLSYFRTIRKRKFLITSHLEAFHCGSSEPP